MRESGDYVVGCFGGAGPQIVYSIYSTTGLLTMIDVVVRVDATCRVLTTRNFTCKVKYPCYSVTHAIVGSLLLQS